jgi:dihydropteroate synthase
MLLKVCHSEFRFPRPAVLMGVLNITPDSFSDGGQFLKPASAIDHALKLINEGADIIDVGGESTRPNATPVSEEEELRRVIPVIKALSTQTKAIISIDTMKPIVARAAVDAGATIVNDVAANRFDPAMARVVSESGAAYVFMHMQGTPQTMQKNPFYKDVVAEVHEFFDKGLSQLAAFGVAQEQVVLDVGIGFGKILEHNLQLLRALGSFTKWNRPLMLGVSRKSFIGSIGRGATGAPPEGVAPEERLPGSLACACWARLAGVQIFRVHDVAATRQALNMIETIMDRDRST